MNYVIADNMVEKWTQWGRWIVQSQKVLNFISEN